MVSDLTGVKARTSDLADEFIYSHLDPSFKLTGKMEEEVLHAFKSLGYPFTISKSYMFAVGTPHSWPYLLAALIWLVDLVKFTQSLANSAMLDQLVIFPNDDEDFDSMPQDKGRIAKLQEQQQIMLLDERKFRDYLGEVDGVIRKHQQMLPSELKSIQAKIQHMQAIYEQQEMTPADVERLRAARQELQRQEEGLEREVDAIDADIWKKEMALARLHEQVDANISEYSKLARALKLIPSTAENAQGIDFELRSSFQEMDSNHFENTIKPALVAMKKRSMEVVHQAESAKLQEDRNMEQFMENITDMKQELAQLDKDIKTKEEELESRKKLYQRDIDGLQATIDQLQQDIRSLQVSSQMSLQDAEKELRDTYSWAEQQKMERIKREQEHVNFMVTVCTLVSDHKTHVQQRLKDLEKDMKQVLVQTQSSAQRMDDRSRRLRDEAASDQ
nr:hypothetical protein BaRGS_012804 [Batillaria attramentaria]